MIHIGIDPDTKATGIGVLVDGAPVKAMLARAKGRFAKDRAPRMVEALRFALDEVLHDYVTSHQIVRVAIEWQRIRPGEHAAKAQNIADLLGVAYLALSATKSTFPLSDIVMPLPIEWKGSIPKEVHQKRIRRYLELDGANAGVLKGMSKTVASHAIDGLGLAFWLFQQRSK